MRRLLVIAVVTGAVLALAVAPAFACAGLVSAKGGIPLLRTTTLAAYADGVEHYVTSFEFAGGGAEFGSIVPLPGVPTKVERGGAWTLERLVLETSPLADAAGAARLSAASAERAQVLQEVRLGALDLTVLKGGGRAVGDWARKQGFALTPDAPEVLDFYARRSPIFLAARYDPAAARARGQQVGDGTPIHLTIPTDNPWVPLRILGLGAQPRDRIQADVYLLTEREPALLPAPAASRSLEVSQPASPGLLTDLRGDRGMSWLGEDMWLSYLKLDTPAATLTHDLAVDVSGENAPSPLMAGLVPPAGTAAASRGTPEPEPQPASSTPLVPLLAAGLAIAGLTLMLQPGARR